MKKLLATLGCLVFLAQAAWSNDRWSGPTRKSPHHGMTKPEAVAYYGEPYRRLQSGADEQWYYKLKFSEVYGRTWVPFEMDSDNVTVGSITFGPDGRVKRYDWNHVVTR